MTRIITDISVSLDGFVTGPDPSPDNGLDTGGEALHTWAFSDGPDDRRVLREGPPSLRTLAQRSVISTSTATHLTYDVSR